MSFAGGNSALESHLSNQGTSAFFRSALYAAQGLQLLNVARNKRSFFNPATEIFHTLDLTYLWRSAVSLRRDTRRSRRSSLSSPPFPLPFIRVMHGIRCILHARQSSEIRMRSLVFDLTYSTPPSPLIRAKRTICA